MASTYLTPTAVTRAIAVVLHQKATFLKRINMQYDAQYAVEGQRKGGGSIKIRLPNQYTVRTGTVMNVQDTTEDSVTLTIGTMKGVDLKFNDTDLALSIEDFTKRFIDPAVAVLVSSIEADVLLGCVNRVPNLIDNGGAAISFRNIMDARRKLQENLAPNDESNLSLLLSPLHNAGYADATKGLFVPAAQLGQQYVSGMVGPMAGVGYVGTSTHLSDLTTGTAAEGDTSYNVTAVSADGYTLTVDTGTTVLVAGDVITIGAAGTCNAVHPETKADLGYLAQFAVDSVSPAAGTHTSIVLSTPLLGPLALGRQTVLAAAATNAAVNKVAAGNGDKVNRSTYFHRDAFAVAFADLENPSKYGAWGSTEVMDNVSCRLWRQGNIVDGTFPCRLDVLYGYKAIRPRMACRIHADS